MLFSSFLILFPLSRRGRWEEGKEPPQRVPTRLPQPPTCTSTLVCGAGTLGAQFPCPLFFVLSIFFFPPLAAAICPCLCVLVPEPLLDWPCELGAPGPTAPAQPVEASKRGRRRPQHAPAMLENSLPFEPHPPLPP